jgi:hypothetical protein
LQLAIGVLKKRTRLKLDIGHAELIDMLTYGEERPTLDFGKKK